MTAPIDSSRSERRPRSRRALLAGALGGLGAFAATAASRLDLAAAAVGDPIRMGRLNKASGTSTTLQSSVDKPALFVNQLGAGSGIKGMATFGRAIIGIAGPGGTAVWARSQGQFGVFASCEGTAVSAQSNEGTGLAAHGRTGADVSGSDVGLHALSGNIAIRATGATAAFLEGGVALRGALDLVERAPGTAAPNGDAARLFTRDNGSGKTELCVLFATGAVQVLATQA